MTRPASLLNPTTEFDAFLYARLGAESDGPSITVLSLLARRDLDPWDQAATFAGMASAEAIGELALMMTATGQAPDSTATSVASRLVSLLPKVAGIQRPPRAVTAVRAVAVERPRRAVINIIVFIVLAACMLGGQWLSIAYRHAGHEQQAADGMATEPIAPNTTPRPNR